MRTGLAGYCLAAESLFAAASCPPAEPMTARQRAPATAPLTIVRDQCGFIASPLWQREGSALHEDRSGALRPLALAHDAEAFGDLGIGLHQSAEVAAEAILVELLARLDIPEPAGIGRDLVRYHDPHEIVLPQAAGLHLEIHKPDADAEEQAGEEIIDPYGERHDVVDLLRRRPPERSDVLLRHHRIAELIVLVIELDDRARKLRALLDAEALRQRTGGHIAHDHFERNDLHLTDQLLAHVEAFDEMRR